jgi:hypothetical protein
MPILLSDIEEEYGDIGNENGMTAEEVKKAPRWRTYWRPHIYQDMRGRLNLRNFQRLYTRNFIFKSSST